MSAYVRVSKLIGWDDWPVPIPDADVVRKLADGARRGCEKSFTELFRLIRFTPSPTTPKARVVMEMIYDAWLEAAPRFREMA